MKVDVGKFGAKGDGVNNDSIPAMAAISQVAASGGGVVYFPPPPVAYRIAPGGLNPSGVSATGIYAPFNNVTLAGDGPASLLRSDGCGNAIWLEGSNNAVEGLTIDVASAADYLCALAVAGTDCSIRRNTFINSSATGRTTPRTLSAINGKGLSNLKITDNVFHDVMVGLGWSDVRGALIAGNSFIRCREMGISLVSAADGHAMNDITVIGNFFEGVTNCGIYFGLDGGAHPITCQRLILKGNIIKGGFSVGGIVGRVTASMEDILIEGNVIDGQESGYGTLGLYGVAILESGNAGDVFSNLSILNNQISHCGANGIYIRAAAKVTRVAGNQIISCPIGVNVEPLTDDADIDCDDNWIHGGSGPGVVLQADAGRTLRARLRRNTIMDHTGIGLKLAKASAGTLNVRLQDSRIGDDQGSPTQTVGIDWNGCSGTPAFVGLDNDLSQSPTAYSPAASGGWTIR